MMQRVLQRFGRLSAMFGNSFAAHPQSVPHAWRSVRNVFVFCMLHIRITKVWFLTCKSMVFDVQKGGF